MKNLASIIILLGCAALSAQTPCFRAKTAKHIAEEATRGEAVRARKIPMNGSVHGWEVLVHMPGENSGWAVVIDRDNSKILKKTVIPNPASKKKPV